jgi:hypothetical protein
MVTIQIESNGSQREYKLCGDIHSVYKAVVREFTDIAVVTHKCMKSNTIIVIKG